MIFKSFYAKNSIFITIIIIKITLFYFLKEQIIILVVKDPILIIIIKILNFSDSNSIIITIIKVIIVKIIIIKIKDY